MQVVDNHLAALTLTNQASSFPPAAECLQHLQSDFIHYPDKKSNKEAFLIFNFLQATVFLLIPVANLRTRPD